VRNRLLALVVFTLPSLDVVFVQSVSAQTLIAMTSTVHQRQPGPASVRASKPNGVLLGTHWSFGGTDLSEVKTGDRTWWIAEVNGGVRVTEIPNILFPRKDGFWVAGTKQIQQGDAFERYIWTAPLGEHARTAEPDVSDPPAQDYHDAREILFVGSDYLAVGEFTSGTGAHYDEGTGYYVTRPENPNLLDDAVNSGLNVSDVLGPVGLDRFDQAVAAMGSGKSDDPICGEITARPEEWAILRDKGRWVVRGHAYYGDPVCDGYFGTESGFAVHMRVPKSVVGYDDLAVGWNRIQHAFLDARDAFESPNGHFLVILRASELVVCRIANGKLAGVIARHPLHADEYAVMAQWALGDNVARWDQQVTRLKNSQPN
jgi:hypothetical protein